MVGQYDMTYRLQNKGIYGDDHQLLLRRRPRSSTISARRPRDYRTRDQRILRRRSDDRPLDRLHHREPARRPPAGRAAARRGDQRQLTRPSMRRAQRAVEDQQHRRGGAPDVAIPIGDRPEIAAQRAQHPEMALLVRGIEHERERHLEHVGDFDRDPVRASNGGSTQPTTGVTR